MTAPEPGTGRLVEVAFAVLVLATFGAFLVASRLKEEPAELADLKRLRHFSPNADGRRDVQRIRFRADIDDEAAVDIVDDDGGRVRRLGERVRIRPGRLTQVEWDGRRDDGARAFDGRYRVRLVLRGEGRAVLSGKPFFLDTQPPDPAALVDFRTPIVAPGQAVEFRIRGAGTRRPPRFDVLRTDVRPARTVRTFRGPAGRRTHVWDGRDAAGAPVPPGTYLIAVTSRDRAGNEGSGPPLPLDGTPVEGRPGVTVRALAVQPPVAATRAGALAAFRVDARGRPYRWRVRRLGTGRPAAVGRRPKRGTALLVRAPRGPSGVYLLEVRSGGASTRVPFAVQARGEARGDRPLVVLPMITWLGRDPVDEASEQDGLPDTFPHGAAVRFPRPFAYEGGLPGGFADGLAPLLVWLDREGVRYDVTTDLALARSGELGGDARRGVLFPAPAEWVSRRLARLLRAHVVDGGRVALFGAGGLRAGVTVGEGRLSRATPPGPTDAFGGRLGRVRSLRSPAGPAAAEPAELSVLQEDPDLGLLEGFPGVLRGFSRVEELVSPGPRAQMRTAVGQALSEAEALRAEREDEEPRPERPVLSAVRLGEGLVIRVGLPEWASRLAEGDPVVEQLTYNVVDVLRGTRPRARTAAG